ncbi:Probable inactive leucine-rich repeat receptor-like protein kinase At3g03770 [Linum perenne]
MFLTYSSFISPSSSSYTMARLLYCFILLFLSWASFLVPLSLQLQTYQTQLLIQLRKQLEYPPLLNVWDNYNADLCNLPSTPHLTLVCHNNLITELKIMGDKKLLKLGHFNGFPVPNHTLSHTFSIDSFVTTLTRLTSLKALSFVSLGIWGPLPQKIRRLNSLQLLDLSSNFIFGSVPPQLSRMVKLNSLVLDANYFNGTVPDWFDSLSSLTSLSLKSNSFEGQFPSSICRIRTLTAISMSHNQLTGKLPDLDALTNLRVLDLRDNKLESDLPLFPKGLVHVLLSNNSFSGEVPAQFGQLNQLQHLDLSLNDLKGTPPSSLFSLPSISYLNLASNMLSGSLPVHLSCGSKLGFVDISKNKLIGGIPACLESNSNKRVVKSGGNCLSIDSPNQLQESDCKEAKQSRFRATGILTAVIGGALVFLGLLACGVYFIYRSCFPRKTLENNTDFKDVQDNDQLPPIAVSSEVLANARFISQTGKLVRHGTPACHVFPLEELKEATNHFNSSSSFMGEGSTGKVYKGRLKNGTLVAIRSVNLLKKQSIQNLKVRLDLLSKLHHPHLVSLLGHCIYSSGQDDSNKVFLVYEYVPNGNYRSRLSEHFREKALRWPDRLTILIGVAKAVQFLHASMVPGTFNNRLKTNNILLDEHQIAKLSDYGMPIITEDFDKLEAKGEGTKLSYRMDLEDDVYNFGFILLESLVGPIVTGKGETFLLNEMASFGSQDGRRRIVDPVVLTTCSQESLSMVVSITSKCISTEPSERPSFEDVLWNLQYAAQVQATADAD